ncbi:xylulokinase [Dongia sp.]|uniref:xylulokinase n=1 Tax=Dongia sp. TaxID=1977262 RepID=UPI0035B2CEF7
MFLGLDLGTSSIKAVLVDEQQSVVTTASAPLEVSRPAPTHSEQDPTHWWHATLSAMDAIAAQAPREMGAVRGIGLSGQMHGATLLDAADRVLRPCILWNDGRSALECDDLEAAWPSLRTVTGNIAMPGFTAPKLLWVRKHEPDIFSAIAKILLPKAYLRLLLSGEHVEEMSDAAGTLWLDVGRRDWSDDGLTATHLSRRQMPRLVEGSAAAGRLRPELARRWKMAASPIIAGGAGDNAAGAVSLGAIRPGDAFVSLGTSGVLWATTARFAPNPNAAVHAFCHCIPQTWHQMGVILSAASCLAWLAEILGQSEVTLLASMPERPARPSDIFFLPYLSGERTPHNDPRIRGAFVGLSHQADRATMVQSVMEGVAFALRDCLEALRAAGTQIDAADVIGGGARSPLWRSILANVLDLPLSEIVGADVSGAFGAARLARLAVSGEPPADVCLPPERGRTIAPDRDLRDAYAAAYLRYRKLYPALKEIAS